MLNVDKLKLEILYRLDWQPFSPLLQGRKSMKFPAFASNQLGHSLLMFSKIYSKWLHGEKSRQEIEKLNTIF